MKTGGLGPGREFDIIRRILETTRGDASGEGRTVHGTDGASSWVVSVGPGDDAAVLSPGGRGGAPGEESPESVPPLVISTDTSVEDVHFRRSWLSPREVGYRAAVAALSDLVAMGADPVAVFASLAGTGVDGDDGTLEEAGAGVADAAEAAGAVLAGGDVTRSPGPLVVGVTVVGSASRPWLRSGAVPGDHLWVTGRLGGAAAAVHALESSVGDVPTELRAAFARPPLRGALARRLRDLGCVTACVDLSDGLLPDAGHLAVASDVRVEVDRASVPVSPVAADHLGPARALTLALVGGEDYEICFTAPPDAGPDLAALARELGVPVTRAGRVTQGEGVHLLGRDGEILPLPAPGFRHFPSA